MVDFLIAFVLISTQVGSHDLVPMVIANSGKASNFVQIKKIVLTTDI
jgi:hypothetical protein